MECELIQLAGVPVGLVTSALFYTTSTDNADSRPAEPEVHLWQYLPLLTRSVCYWFTATLF